MANNFSDFLENEILKRVLNANASAMALPTALYIALFSADPGEDETSHTDVVYTGYTRMDLDGGGAVGSGFSVPASGVANNLLELTFPANGDAAPSTITHMAIVDNATINTGNLLFVSALTASKTLQQNDRVVFGVGSLQITVD